MMFNTAVYKEGMWKADCCIGRTAINVFDIPWGLSGKISERMRKSAQ